MNRTNADSMQRLSAKTAQQHFLGRLEQGFHYAPRVAEAILAEAEDCLYGAQEALQPGQMRVILTRRGSPAGQSLRDTAQVAVVWTIDAGVEDRAIQACYGARVLRQVRIQRLLDEAVEQGGVATQEDLAQVLHSSVRTIKRDFAALQQEGQWLSSRGYLDGMGRGQTHKAQIVQRWLRGETYDQLVTRTHHSVKSIQRYLRTFVQVVALSQQGIAVEDLPRLLQIGAPLVGEYLAIYQAHAAPAERQRLAEQLQRFQQASAGEKGGHR